MCLSSSLGLSETHAFVVLLQIPDYRNAVIVARNPASANKATSYAERLRLGIAVIHGEHKVECAEAESEHDEVRSKTVGFP